MEFDGYQIGASIVDADLALTSGSDMEGCDSQFEKVRSRKTKRQKRELDNRSRVEDILLDNKRPKNFDGNSERVNNQGANNSNSAKVSDGSASEDERRHRLWFPYTLEMDYQDKLRWTVKLCKNHREFEVLFKEGKHRPYITVKNEEAVNFLTTVGYENVILVKPTDSGKFTKVILFDYPLCMDPEDLCADERVVWAKRREIKYKGKIEPKPQLIVLMKGEAPGKLFVPCIGYRNVTAYYESPVQCYKCNKWGHMAYKCHNSFRCRYCSKNHDSKECSDKIKENVKIVPRCCNCGEGHNANSKLCKKRPLLGATRVKETASATPVPDPACGPTTAVNVWEKRAAEMKRRREEAMTGAPANDHSTRHTRDVINELRMEIEGLREVILGMQKQIDRLSNNKVAVVNSTDYTEKNTINDGRCGNDELLSVGGEVSTVENEGNGTTNGTLWGGSENSKCFVERVTCVLDAVVDYMLNPNDVLKTTVLETVKRFRLGMQENGGF